MSATELQNQGRQAYKRGDFVKALEYFNRALGRQQTVALYDNRAATYEKLNDFQKALQDAKGAIRAGDVDPTGYLRAGRILVKMEKSKAALDIYAYGLRHVKHVGQGYEQLEKCHDDLLAKFAPTNSVDPLTVLPRELAISVLEYCTFRQRIAICRVSKGWQKFIRSEPNLWSHLDLGAVRTKKVKTSFVSVAINTAKKKLTAATLSNLFDFDKVLHALLRHCPLEVLTLAQTGMQGRNLLDVLQKVKDRLVLKELRILPGTEISQTTLRETATACQRTLEVLYCSHLKNMSFTNQWNTLAFPKLKSLSITADQIGDLTLGLPKFLTNTPNLTSLTLINLDRYHHETIGGVIRLDLRDTGLEHINFQLCLLGADCIQLPPTTKTLRLVSAGAAHASFFSDPPEPNSLQLQDLPLLEEAHFNLPATPYDRILSQFETRLPTDHAVSGSPPLSNLRSLSLQRARIADIPSYAIPTRLQSLQSLALRDMLDLPDQRIVQIVKELPMLRSLDVSGSQITGAGVGDLLKLGQLTEMVLNDCHKIGHRDAVDRAKKAGVKVECKMSDGVGGGKKVRY
ncbi:Putative Heat shock protein Sti1 [Septoria linicola]|uniref:Heat shock protein Sti1 n=1 Tax=Septoria linicola TaxID=215465 RepID=A0A9Q9AZ26_9PEZI|nr:Putative Heat shock protein Sti1 [Septoria linicola]